MEGPQKILVALSGGADSVSLLLSLRAEKTPVIAAHCNFHLRGAESDRDERFVTELCQKYGIRLFIKHFDTARLAKERGESIEMTARALRYEWFAELCKAEDCKGVAVGHHQEDNAETILLNLIRGTGIRGLTGMRAHSVQNRMEVYRPLLHKTKAEILSLIRQFDADYITDSTNSDTHYRRNKIRHEVIPMLRTINPNIVTTLTQMGERLTETLDIYDYAVEKMKAEVVSVSPDKRKTLIDAERLKSLPSPKTLIYECLRQFGFSAAQAADALDMHVGGWIENKDYLLTRTAGAWEVERRSAQMAETLIPMRDSSLSLPDGKQLTVRYLPRRAIEKIPRQAATATIDAACVKGSLRIRPVRTGDRFHPFGMKGTKLVSDYLTDRHISRNDRQKAMVVCDEQGILWLVGDRPDERTRVSPNTEHIILLTYSDTL